MYDPKDCKLDPMIQLSLHMRKTGCICEGCNIINCRQHPDNNRMVIQ